MDSEITTNKVNNMTKETYSDEVKGLIQQAESGDVDAIFELCEMYLYGEGGVRRDLVKAIEWYTKVAEAEDTGMYTLPAMYNLGVIYQSAKFVKDYDVKAMEWLTKAAEGRYVNAMFMLGWMYREKDEAKAAYWDAKAREEALRQGLRVVD